MHSINRAENAKALVQEIFGIKFHSAFPKQVKTDCDDDCGGCGIYPNIMRGRRGAQMLAESGSAVSTDGDKIYMYIVYQLTNAECKHFFIDIVQFQMFWKIISLFIKI